MGFSFRKAFRALFFMACLTSVLRQCYLSMERFLEEPRSVSVDIDHASNWPLPRLIICPPVKEEVLKECGNFSYEYSYAIDYYHLGIWVIGNCTDPKSLFEKAIYQPIEMIDDVLIRTYQGETFYYEKGNNFDNETLWKPIDFVYDAISPLDEPIVALCYELTVPEKVKSFGIKYIEVLVTWGVSGFVKISPPGYFYQNSEVTEAEFYGRETIKFELDYQVDNYLKFGDEICNPDPLYNRDEDCVKDQILKVRLHIFSEYSIFRGFLDFSAFNGPVQMHTAFVG